MKKDNIQLKQRKILLFFALLLLGIPASFGQFYPVPKTPRLTADRDIDIIKIDSTTLKTTVEPFSISELITVKEFKEYLATIKNDSSAQFPFVSISNSNIPQF